MTEAGGSRQRGKNSKAKVVIRRGSVAVVARPEIMLLLYLLVAYITLFVFDTITVWPATGVALAAFLLFGSRVWPWIFLASLLVVYSYFASLGLSLQSGRVAWVALATAVGNCVAGATAWWCCGRVTTLKHSFAELTWVLHRFLPATLMCGVVGALFGVGVYQFPGMAWPDPATSSFANWSVSNTMGALVLAPLLITCLLHPRWRRSLVQVRLKFSALLLLLLLGFFLFGPGEIWLPAGFLQPALLLIPLLLVALTANQCFIFLFQALTFLLIWVGTDAGYGPFVSSDPITTDTAMQVFCGFLAAVVLIIQALLCEQRKLRKLWSAELLSSNRKLELRVQERTRQLSQANEQLELLSVTDALTQLANRRRFDSYLQAEWQRACRLGQPIGLMMLDVDWFKNYNDSYGHLQGDEVLRQVGQLLKLGARRTTDLAARYGGEEFALVVPQADAGYLQQQAELLRFAFASLNIPHQSSPLGRLTVSIGVAVWRPKMHESTELLIEKADQALYQAKNSGRNQVACAADLVTVEAGDVRGH